MKGVHPPLTDQSSTVRAEVVEVGPQFNPPGEHDAPSKKGGWNWLRLAGLVVLLLVGIGLMPGAQRSSPSTTVNLTLAQPVVASSTIPVAPRAVAVVTDETFSLIPVADLDGFANFAGPVEFAGRHWMAANSPPPSNTAVILSSTDSSNWVQQSELTGTEASLIVQELVVFRSNLVLVATQSSLPETPIATGQSQQIVAWTSADGGAWSVQELPNLKGAGYYDMTAAAGNDRLIVSAATYEAYGELTEAVVPAEFHPAIASGQLFAIWERRSDILTAKVMAPPGLEVFSTEVTVTSPGLMYHSRALLTENLINWDVLEPPLGGISALAWSDDLGFIRRAFNGETLISADGHFWERTADLPPADFRTWSGGLLGLVDTTGGTLDLLVVDNGTETRIGLPSDMFVANGYPSIETGPSGLFAAVTRYLIQTDRPATVTSGGMLLTLNTDLLVITKNGQDHARIRLWTPSAKATYDPDSGLIEIPRGEGIELTTIPLEDLAVLWSSPPNSARTEFYQSPDGLIWSKGESAVFSDGVNIIGGTDDGFLVAVGANAVPGWAQDMTVLRTGPID